MIKVNTYAEGCDDPNENNVLYCSNVKNFVALLGVSTIIGGNIPL